MQPSSPLFLTLPASPATFAVTNPATGKILGHVAKHSAADTRAAIEAAHRAYPAWRARTAASRAALLRKWFELIMQHQDELAEIMTLEQGKPLLESRSEIVYAASFIEWFAEEAKRVYGKVIPAPKAEQRIIATKEPVGVCSAITPWNFPAAMITRKAAPALAAGCTMVVKPASETPFSALALAKLAERAGIPAGVLQVMTGDARTIGAELTTHPLIRKFSFTGSTEIGKLLIKQCADTVKKMSMELGGNAPFIVFDDANLEDAVAGFVASKFRNMGQTCVCTNRALVQESVAGKFTARVAEEMRKLKVGNGWEPGVTQGPLINIKAVEKVEELLADAVQKGATIALGGKRHALGGSFFEPTLVSNATESMRFARDEIFGPIAPIFIFRDEADAIRMANATEFGLAAYFYANDISRITRVSEALEYGIIGVNQGLISTEVAPFGGMKESGFGREGSWMGMEEYLETKYICLGIK